MKTYKGNILELKEDEVFVFGSNLSGFHGAGSAGFATFNESGNVWRKHGYQNWPNGTKGRWNVKGIGEGPQIGEIGKSYALPTVTRAGAKRSLTPQQITANIKKLYDFAEKRPHLKFYVAQSAEKGLNGFEGWEMADMFSTHPIPNNVYFEENFAKLFKS